MQDLNQFWTKGHDFLHQPDKTQTWIVECDKSFSLIGLLKVVLKIPFSVADQAENLAHSSSSFIWLR